MKRKDKLYTVNKWNKPMLIQKGNVFGFGGSDKPSDWTKWNSLANNYFTNEQKTNLVSVGLDPTEVYKKSTNFLGISKENNPFSNGNLSSTIGAIGPGIGTALGNMVGNAIGNGYETNASGTVGTVVSGLQSINLGNPLFNTAKNFVLGTGLGIYNRGFGIKENKENTSAIKTNTTQARIAGDELASANTNEAVLAAAGKMTGSSGFKASDLYKNGWWTSKGTKEGNKLINKEDVALAYQGKGFKTGADNADRTLDEGAQSSFKYGFGGPLEMIMDNSGGIGATEYGLISDLANKKPSTKDSMVSPLAGVPSTMFAKGGKINIKKSHRGKLTELKKRTGKTEAELYNDGNPAHKKMVVFARNARKWKKAYGGFLDATDNLFAEGGPKGDKWVTPVGTVSAGGFVPNNTRGSYGGGKGTGGGAGTKFRDVPEYETVTKNDTIWIPIERNFNDAFRDAARRGLTEFEFNNITYPVEYADKEGWEEAGNARKEVIGAIPVTTERKTTTRKKAEGGPINVLNPYCGGGKMFALGGPDNLPQFLRYAGALGSALSVLPKNTTVEPELTAPTRRDVQPSDLSSILLKEYSKPYLTAVKQSRVSPILRSEYAPLGEVYRQAALENENKARQIAEFNRSVNGLNNTAFALGGDMQTNGADWSNGMTHIDAGSTHELNPNEGVQVGVDNQGVPNLVEEGEVIFNDYVYSNRIEIDDQTKEAFRISKKRKITYADLAKKLEKESLERPNDPISKAALKVQMEDLANEQERQKSEMQATEARQAFEALSPEEQVAVMQQMQAQEQQAQEAAMQEQAMAEQQAMQGQQVPPEMMQGAPAEAVPQEQMIPQEQAPVMAYGGNLFGPGGDMDDTTYNWYKDNIVRLYPSFKNSKQLDDIIRAVHTYSMQNQAKIDDAGLKKIMTHIFNGPTGVVNRKAPETEAGAAINRRHFDDLRALGIPAQMAFSIAFPAAQSEKQKAVRGALAQQLGISTASVPVTEASTNTKNIDAASGATTNVQYVDTPSGTIAGTGILEETPKAPLQQSQGQVSQSSGTANSATRATTRGTSGLNLYGYYTNGSDGYSTPTGFKVGTNGRAYDYTNEYRDLVNRLGADDIRRWAAEHPNDVSLKSFIARGNNLDKLTDEQWRYGALDNKYGFMHHVADQILNNPTPTEEPTDASQFDIPETRIIGMSKPGITDREIVEGVDSNGVPVIYDYTPIPEENENPDLGFVAQAGNEDTEVKTTTNPISNNIKPVLRKEWPRYMGLFGPAVGLGMQLAGIGKPDTKLYDSVIEGFDKRGAALADYRPIGDYMAYRPMDIWATQNRMDANARATDRALLNNSSASRAAGLLANAYTSQLGTGELHRQAHEYNDNLRKQVAEFNRGTNQFNASAYNQAALANAQIRNQDRNLRAQLGMQAAAYKNNANDNWYGSIYANVGNLFKGIGDLGRENAERNMLSKLLASGYTNLNDIMGEGWVQEAAEGGKLKRKKNKRRGLTF